MFGICVFALITLCALAVIAWDESRDITDAALPASPTRDAYNAKDAYND